MYTVVGKRPGMCLECEYNADVYIGAQLSPLMMGYALRVIPDGVVVLDTDTGVYLMADRMQLVPAPAGMTVTTRRNPNARDATQKELRESLDQIKAMSYTEVRI